jgi:RHS repeat-associated protein
VFDGVRRIAMVETKTISGGAPVTPLVNLFRFQYTNHLGSAHLECDQSGAVISYEELAPYGASSYRSAPSASEVSARRYRYTGKERDEETGLDYFGARFYAPWLGRWTTADPLGLQAGVNLYLYARGSPIVFNDPSGLDAQRPQEKPLPLQLTGENPAEYLGEGTGSLSGEAPPPDSPRVSQARTEPAPDLSGMSQPSEMASEEPPVPPGFERGHAEPPPEFDVEQAFKDLLEGLLDPLVGEAGTPTSVEDQQRQETRISEAEFAFNFALTRILLGRSPFKGGAVGAEVRAGEAAAGRAGRIVSEGGTATKGAPKSWTDFLPEAEKRLKATKERLGNPSDDIVNMGRKADIKQVDRIVDELKLTKDQRRLLHDEITGQRLSIDEIREIAEDIRRQFPNKGRK